MRFAWGFLAAALLGILMAGMVQAAVLECDSCGSCNSGIAGASGGDIIQLNTSLSGISGTCISFGGKDNLTFDCLGNTIGGDGSGSGIWLNDSEGGSFNVTVTGCVISGFYYGIQINSSSGNMFYNNLFNNSFNLNSSSSQNWWNTTQSAGPNIAGGPYMGGNFWADPSGNGFSQTCTDSDGDWICDSAYLLDSGNADYLALTRDSTPPSIAFAPPTPPNGTQVNQSWIFINASASEPLSSCILDWNGSNQTFSPSGPSCAMNKTSLPEGAYAFSIYANDTAGNWNSTETRYLTINLSLQYASDYMAISYGINPRLLYRDSNTTISFNVTTNGTLDSILVRIVVPDSPPLSIFFSGNSSFSYMPSVAGTYSLTIFANTTAGYSQSISDSFEAVDCMENDTMECGIGIGECRKGNLTCYGGSWGTDCQGSIGPQAETCNGKDDDCNGIIDDVAGGTSVQSTQCQCYNGQAPLADEPCNGIDDNCDGQIDNNANCCTDGQTRACGTSLNVGACHPGTSACSGGTWSQCSGAVFPTTENCNDLVDDDCDGLTDYQDTQDCRPFNLSQTVNQTATSSTCGNGVMDGNEQGTDCGGDCPPCFDYTAIWMTISIIGAAILGILLFMYFYLRRQGRELTWEELTKKWTPEKGYHYKAG